MKRALEPSTEDTSDSLEDASDRAQKCRRKGDVRIGLDRIGFWDENRGGVGVSAHHAHECAWDCKANKTKFGRYSPVELVEVPSDELSRVREYNRDKCETDPLMPRFAPDIEFVCVGKTHFVHAQKLAKDGNRNLFNSADPKQAIVWQADDVEGHIIQKDGPLCAI